jgi:hypothetical protein
MNVLDENILEEQRVLLLKWSVPFRQIGFEVGRKGMKDTEIIPFLHTLSHPTFFTRDLDFCKRGLCHVRYCLTVLAVDEAAAALFVRRVLRHPDFRTQAKRMGKIIRASHEGLLVWRVHAEQETFYNWPDSDGRPYPLAVREEECLYVVGYPEYEENSRNQVSPRNPVSVVPREMMAEVSE